MSEHDPEGPPRFTDKRRIDPETGEVRQPAVPDDAAEPDPLAALDFDTPGELVPGHQLEAAEALAAERLDELQRRNAAYYNLEQQFSSFVKRSKADGALQHEQGVVEVVEALIGVLDDIDLARQHGDLAGPFVSISDKLEQTLQRFGIERYGEVGEVFDPTVHEALMHGHSPDVTEPTVQAVLQPGYRVGDRIVRAVRVAVVDPDA